MRAHLVALICVAGCGGKPAANDVKSPTGPVDPTAGATAATMPDPAAAKPAALARPAVPAELAIPDGHQPVLVANAKGVQIYECVAEGSAAPAWKLHAPRADLFDDAGAMIGSHFGGVDKSLAAGPYWEAKDGSRVHGAKPVSAPNPSSIPLLRIEAADTAGTGVLSKVTYVHRLDTTGGVAPAGACTKGKTAEVPYTAKYYFYAAG
jgi:Protein of unknown function (DUF3455)